MSRYELSAARHAGEVYVFPLALVAENGSPIPPVTAHPADIVVRLFQQSIKIQVSFSTRCQLSVWAVPFTHRKNLLELMVAREFIVTDLPVNVINAIERPVVNSEYNIIESKTPNLQLRDYQLEAVRKVLRYKRLMFSMEMGLGKTPTSIYAYIQVGGTCLIVCPASLRKNWAKEFLRFTGIAVCEVIKVSDIVPNRVNIISYTLLHREEVAKRLNQLKISMFIVDESHYVKNADAKRTKALVELIHKNKEAFVILLTGTPASRPMDLFSQLAMLDGATFNKFFPKHPSQWYKRHNEFFFAQRYCDPTLTYIHSGKKVFTFKGCTRPWELQAMLNRYMFRKTKNDITSGLPKKLRYKTELPCFNQTDAVDMKKGFQELDRLREVENGEATAQRKLMELVRLTSKLKQKWVVPKVLELVDHSNWSVNCTNSGKVLVFTHHHDMTDAICSVLVTAGIPHIRIDGRVVPNKRAELVNLFQTDIKTKVAVLSIKAAGTGLNLFAANKVIFTELIWDTGDMLQAEDRAHRIGQKHDVHIQYLIQPDSTDDIVWQTLNHKMCISSKLIDNRKCFIRTDNADPERKRLKTNMS
jgi:SWI/SNF-related matrix-associated actin-dependent regulator 1 of chromatin subfamily A